MDSKSILSISIIVLILLSSTAVIPGVSATKIPKDRDAHPPIHVKGTATPTPTGLSPAQITHAYGFDTLSCFGTSSCGSGQTIAIIDAFDDPNIAADLNKFDTQFGLPACTTINGCFTKAIPQGLPTGNTGWALEESLDVEWAHAVAPGAKIILVEAKDNLFSSLNSAVDYAVAQTNVHQVSMSWGGGDSADDTIYDSHFNVAGVSFTASSGDSGTGVIYPAASPYVISVGGTTLHVDGSGNVQNETAWSGSGGGVSSFESKPIYQIGFNSNTGRGVPDVSYAADPNTGVSVYDSYGYGGWIVVGGTSAGAPQWAAAISIANSQRTTPFSSTSFDANTNLYTAAGGTSYNLSNIYFRDITSGKNGACGSLCKAVPGYDFVTGLGSPLLNKLIPFLSPPQPLHTTSTIVTPNPSTITLASTVTFHATITDTSSSPTTPKGTVSWSDGAAGGHFSTSSCTLKLSSSSSSTCTSKYTPSSVTGPVTINATYSGDVTHAASSGTSALKVTLRHTSTIVTPNPSSVVHGNQITFLANVTDTSPGTKTTPTGLVSWKASVSGGSFTSSTCTLNPIDSTQSQCSVKYTAPLTTGTITISGTFGSDSLHAKSAGKSTLTVS